MISGGEEAIMEYSVLQRLKETGFEETLGPIGIDEFEFEALNTDFGKAFPLIMQRIGSNIYMEMHPKFRKQYQELNFENAMMQLKALQPYVTKLDDKKVKIDRMNFSRALVYYLAYKRIGQDKAISKQEIDFFDSLFKQKHEEINPALSELEKKLS
jgi:hypothetical protein